MTRHINLLSSNGLSIHDKLCSYVKTHADPTKKSTVLSAVEFPEMQRGESCKLKSLNDAISTVAARHNVTKLPLYKDRLFSHSLRSVAKSNGSVVGEIYSVEMLTKICRDAGFQPQVHSPMNEDEYIITLESLLDNGHTPMVIFNVNTDTGFPYIGDGNNEHSAVLVGYYRTPCDETQFIVSQWGDYFDIDGMELAHSACNSSVKENLEIFYKYMNLKSGKTVWSLEPAPHLEEITDAPARFGEPIEKDKTPLRGKIVTVVSPLSRQMQSTSVGSLSCHGFFELPVSRTVHLSAPVAFETPVISRGFGTAKITY